MSSRRYWECTLNAITWHTDDGKGDGPDIIVDDGGDMTLLIHEGKKAEDAFAKDGTLPDPTSTENAEFKVSAERTSRVWEGICGYVMIYQTSTSFAIKRMVGSANQRYAQTPEQQKGGNNEA